MMQISRTLALLSLLAACGPGKSDDGDDDGATVEPGTSTGGPPTTSLGMSSTISAGTDPTPPPGDDTSGGVSATVTTVAPPSDSTTSTTSPSDTTDPGVGSTTEVATTAGSTTEPPGDDSAFIVPLDMLGFGCDPWAEDCPAGEKCMPFDSGGGTWDALKCVPLDARPQQVGEACVVDGDGQSGIDNCALHAMCAGLGDDLMGTCVGMCEGAPEEPSCPAGSSCAITNNGVLNLCLQNCDPLEQDCAAGEVCVGNGPAFNCVFEGFDSGAVFEPCESINGCDPGLFCGAPDLAPQCDPAQNGCCLPHCDLDGPATCPPGTACVPWFEDGAAPPGLEDVGACADL